MLNWETKETSTRSFTARIGSILLLLHERCGGVNCHKWMAIANPFLRGREIEAETLEEAKDIAVMLLKKEVEQILVLLNQDS